MAASPAALVQSLMPCMFLKWNLTQWCWRVRPYNPATFCIYVRLSRPATTGAMRTSHSSHGLTASSAATPLLFGRRWLCCFRSGLGIERSPYRVRVDNEWVDVPDDAIITEPNRYGRTMIWPTKARDSIPCFMPVTELALAFSMPRLPIAACIEA